MDKLLNEVYKDKPSKEKYFDWFRQMDNMSNKEDDFTHLITRNTIEHSRTSEPALIRTRNAALKAKASGRMYTRGNTRYFAFRQEDFAKNFTTRNDLTREINKFTNLEKYSPDKHMLNYFKSTTNDTTTFDNRLARRRHGGFKERDLYEGYMFFKLGD